jgi:hypothetical protein
VTTDGDEVVEISLLDGRGQNDFDRHLHGERVAIPSRACQRLVERVVEPIAVAVALVHVRQLRLHGGR